MKRGFTLMEILMGMALLALILVTALCVLQWALLGSTRQQAQTRAAFLAQQQMDRLWAADEPKSGQGIFGNGYAWKTNIKPLGDFLQVEVQVKGPAGASFTLASERRKELHQLVFRSDEKVFQTAEDVPEPVAIGEGVGSDYCISPDGQQMAYVAPYEGRPQIWLRRLHSAQAPQLLVNHPEGAGEPRFSPDGTQLSRLTDDPAYDTAPQLKGERILFQSNRDGVQRLYSMNLDGSELTPVTPDQAAEDPQWTR